MNRTMGIIIATALLLFAPAMAGAVPAEAIDGDAFFARVLRENPGQIVEVPPGDYRVTHSIILAEDGAGLQGSGRILMATANEPIILAKDIRRVTIDGVTLERETNSVENVEAIRLERCSQVVLDGVRVENNRAIGPTVRLKQCTDNRIVNCAILNYKQAGPDVRPTYTFIALNGHGIAMQHCWGNLVQGNTVIERELLASKENQKKYRLGEVVAGENPVGDTMDHYPGWHQGAGIGSFRGGHSVIVGNYIENACQGFDFQTDQSVLTGNTVRIAQVGIKCMQFTENVIISNNNISFTDLWGIVMTPGQTAKPPEAGDEDIYAINPVDDGDGDRIMNPTQIELLEKTGLGLIVPEFTNGNIIANNVFSHFGEGPEYDNWVPALPIDDGFLTVINLWGQWVNTKANQDQKFHPDCGMKSILVQGNIIYNSGQDGKLVDGKTIYPAPKYRYAIYKDTEAYGPSQVFISGNILHEGYEGVSNAPLTEQEKMVNFVVHKSTLDAEQQ